MTSITDEFEHLPKVTGSVPEDVALEVHNYDNQTLHNVISDCLHVLTAFGREKGYMDSKLYPYLNLITKCWWILKERK